MNAKDIKRVKKYIEIGSSKARTALKECEENPYKAIIQFINPEQVSKLRNSLIAEDIVDGNCTRSVNDFSRKLLYYIDTGIILENEICNFNPGKKLVLGSRSPNPDNDYGVVFEDDGISGYFYACYGLGANVEIQDAVFIYETPMDIGFSNGSVLSVLWLDSGQVAILKLGNQSVGAFAFQTKEGYCISGISPMTDTSNEWSRNGYEWNSRFDNA